MDKDGLILPVGEVWTPDVTENVTDNVTVNVTDGTDNVTDGNSLHDAFSFILLYIQTNQNLHIRHRHHLG